MAGRGLDVARTNFGRNQTLRPSATYTPVDEREVLRILDRHRGERIRAVGSLHSWSEAVSADGVLLDLRRLDDVQLLPGTEHLVAVAGAGCRIDRLLGELDRQGATLPSLGLITKQTIAGAISTGTHGSGRPCMSHFVSGVRLARYDTTSGEAIIEDIGSGDALRAACCSLGSVGIILAVQLRCRAQYRVEEHFREYPRLPDVLRAEASFPLQQFYLIPWRWSYFAQHRREEERPRSRLAGLYRLYWLLVMDIGMHLLITSLVRLVRSTRLVRLAYRALVPAFVIRNWRVTDRSSSMLVMKHEAFRHIEIELFVRREHLAQALELAREVIEVADGRASSLSASNQQRIEELGLSAALNELLGRYCHHYPICVRRVIPDDSMISMASGAGEDWYALSFISYARPAHRDGFFLFASFLGRSMARLFHARPHWGKVCPLEASELADLYPRLAEFRAVCEQLDPAAVFRNDWTAGLLEAVERPQDTP